MKSLGRINWIASALRRISYVFLILSIIVFIALLIFFMRFLLDVEALSMERIRLMGVNDRKIELEALDIIIYLVVLMLFFAKEVCLFNLAYKYFFLEKNAGTPFNSEASAALGRLGICKIIISVLHNVVTVILIQFTSDGVFDASLLMNYNPLPPVALGVMLIFASAITRYGSEIVMESD